MRPVRDRVFVFGFFYYVVVSVLRILFSPL
jgi:hypothetical protein